MILTALLLGVQITTSDGQGEILIDGKAVGTGAFHGDLPAGKHRLAVRRDGFQTHEETIDVVDGVDLTKSVALSRLPAKETDVTAPESFGGIYGGWMIAGAFQPAGTGSSFESRCDLFGASSCTAPSPSGLMLGLHIGYTWDPVGIELFGGPMLDYAEWTATYDGVIKPGSNAALTGPPRVESWRMVRYGFVGAIRARATWSLPKIRLSAALGPGLAFKNITSDRQMRTTDMSNLTDDYRPDDISYASAALSFELAFSFRATKRFAFTAGMEFWFENAGQNVLTKADPDRKVGPIPLRTPEYRLASGSQAFFGPFVGMTFGP